MGLKGQILLLEKITGKRVIFKESDNPDVEFGGSSTSLEDLQKEYPSLVFTLKPSPKWNKRYFARVDLRNRGRELEYLGALKGPVTKSDAIDWFKLVARKKYNPESFNVPAGAISITGKKDTLLEKITKYKKVKDQIQNMKIPSELKERILALVNTGTRISDKHPVIHGLTKPTDFNKRVKEHNLPTGYELGADKKGFFVATQRARSKSYENAVDIPIDSIKFIDSTG